VNICGGNGRACQHERRPSRKASAARCAANHRTKSIVIASGRGVRICETCVAEVAALIAEEKASVAA